MGHPRVVSGSARPGKGVAGRRPGRRPGSGRPSIVVRQADAGDLEAITAMRLALLAEEHESPLFARRRSDAAQRARRVTEAQLAGRAEAFLVAMDRDTAVGMLRCVVAPGSGLVRGSRHARLTSVFVRPAYRRRGVLRQLLDAADGWCRSRRLREIRLHCTVENAIGNAAWLALGFMPAEILHRRPVPNA